MSVQEKCEAVITSSPVQLSKELGKFLVAPTDARPTPPNKKLTFVQLLQANAAGSSDALTSPMKKTNPCQSAAASSACPAEPESESIPLTTFFQGKGQKLGALPSQSGPAPKPKVLSVDERSAKPVRKKAKVH